MASLKYKRRPTIEVKVGSTAIGGQNPVRLQSMASTSTMDTPASVAQALRIVEAGAELVRFTAQGVREAENLGEIRRQIRAAGVATPLVADIHFNPRAAFAAAETVEKVRINPGNFVDPGRTFRKIEFTDEEYAAELKRLEAALIPFLEKCRANGTAIRLGVNHGSLSDRIMSRYGDTPAGMVESAMEFLRVFRKENFNDVVISIKASNVVVMVSTVLLLVDAMEREGMAYPLHLGVTEAGDGEDGRIKSALGIGSLLALGIGDTIRVSLSEEPEFELPVARRIMDYIDEIAAAPSITGERNYTLCCGKKRSTEPLGNVGGESLPVVVGESASATYDPEMTPDLYLDTDGEKFQEIDAADVLSGRCPVLENRILLMSSTHADRSLEMAAAIERLSADGVMNPVVVRADYRGLDEETVAVRASIELGSLFLSGLADGLMIVSDSLSAEKSSKLAFSILQSARLRFSKTEFISCPGCGRTLFDLQATLAKVKEATSHLKGLKIGVMGCIVNGPGEMADADYGYVGAGTGRVSLYKGKECVERNIPAEEAVGRLVALIKSCGDWK
ncbi:MAG: (E)-4-hydroxy-3-methylbut-2-enyl-diphosphate synthase [Paramuribaculum sp.]|nr:(E)-4-hydroxy-3-methylbut-2-enyl-diphosphate synthase [Paramuribaculum sp.]